MTKSARDDWRQPQRSVSNCSVCAQPRSSSRHITSLELQPTCSLLLLRRPRPLNLTFKNSDTSNFPPLSTCSAVSGLSLGLLVLTNLSKVHPQRNACILNLSRGPHGFSWCWLVWHYHSPAMWFRPQHLSFSLTRTHTNSLIQHFHASVSMHARAPSMWGLRNWTFQQHRSWWTNVSCFFISGIQQCLSDHCTSGRLRHQYETKSNCLRKLRWEKEIRSPKGITLLGKDLSALSKYMPSWPLLMHALSNVSWQLVRGQFDTITSHFKLDVICLIPLCHAARLDTPAREEHKKHTKQPSFVKAASEICQKCLSEYQRKRCVVVKILHVATPVRQEQDDISGDLPDCCLSVITRKCSIVLHSLLHKLVLLTWARGVKCVQCLIWYIRSCAYTCVVIYDPISIQIHKVVYVQSWCTIKTKMGCNNFKIS